MSGHAMLMLASGNLFADPGTWALGQKTRHAKSGGNESNALCGYPHVKVSIRDLSQISTAAPIFQLYIYFRQNLEENVTFTFFFLVLPQISLVKYYETIKILMQIFVYFKLHFHNEGLDCQKNYFEMFFCDWPLLSS